MDGTVHARLPSKTIDRKTTFEIRRALCEHSSPLVSWVTGDSVCVIPKERQSDMSEQKAKHTAGGVLRWSPILILVAWFSAYVWQRYRKRSAFIDSRGGGSNF